MEQQIQLLSHRPYQAEDYEQLSTYIMGLYIEDHAAEKMNQQKIDNTIRFFSEHPELGEILVITFGAEMIGYCIITNYWSNEYGGRMVLIDEFFIDQKYRGQGLGTIFLQNLLKENRRQAVAHQLEVFYTNERALQLYRRLGFRDDERHHLAFLS